MCDWFVELLFVNLLVDDIVFLMCMSVVDWLYLLLCVVLFDDVYVFECFVWFVCDMLLFIVLDDLDWCWLYLFVCDMLCDWLVVCFDVECSMLYVCVVVWFDMYGMIEEVVCYVYVVG